VAIPPAQLESVHLGRLEFAPDPSFPVEELARVTYEVAPGVGIGELRSNERGLESDLTLRASIAFSRVEEDEGPLPFEMTIELHGSFVWVSDALPPDEDIARAWLDYNGMYLMWPYLRSYVAAITGMSHLPALTIYTMNVPKPPVIPPPPEDASAGTAAETAEANSTDS
jgi:hypothetical protein